MCSPRVRLDQTELEPKDDDREVDGVRSAAFLLSGFPLILIRIRIISGFPLPSKIELVAAAVLVVGDDNYQIDRVSFLPLLLLLLLLVQYLYRSDDLGSDSVHLPSAICIRPHSWTDYFSRCISVFVH